jgi:hypothetical protein
MKRIRDAFLYLLRSIAGYVLFYWLLLGQDFAKIEPWWLKLIAIIVLLEVFNLVVIRLMRKLFEFDPLFMVKMPILPFALYRMALEFFFLVFLFTVLNPLLNMPLMLMVVCMVGVSYFLGVVIHWVRYNRMMIEGKMEG